MVYNVPYSGLNGFLWGAHLILPIILTKMQEAKDIMHMAYIDIS